MDLKKKNSAINQSPAPPVDAKEYPVCYFNGEGYSPGSRVCSVGIALTCGLDGEWRYSGSC